MDLTEILNKTKKRSEQIKNVRKPPSIAFNDRPYSPLDVTDHDPPQKNYEISFVKKTDNKLATNRQQTGNKTDNKPTTNWQQTGNKNDLEKQTGNKLATEPTTEPTTNRQQTGNKLATKTSFSMLVGLQRNCLLFIYESCKANRSKATEPLSLEHMAQYIKASPGTIKTTLQRLVEKNCLIRTGFKNGRGGWATFEIPEALFTELLRQETGNKLATNWQQTGNKLATEPATELATSVSSSSSNIKTTTTKEIEAEVENINFEELKAIGFTKNHLVQIVTRSNLRADIIQESIDAFVFDLKKNKKATTLKKSPLEFFMGILVKGQAYTPPENYETPQEESLRLYLERKRVRLEKAEQMKKEMLKLACEQWRRKPNNQETIENIIKGIDPMLRKIHPVVEGRILEHYEKTVWPLEKNDFFKDIDK